MPSHRALCPEGSQCSVSWAAIALLNILIMFEQEIPHLHLAPGLHMTQPVLSRNQGPRTCLPPTPSPSLTTHFPLLRRCSGAGETLTCCQGMCLWQAVSRGIWNNLESDRKVGGLVLNVKGAVTPIWRGFLLHDTAVVCRSSLFHPELSSGLF